MGNKEKLIKELTALGFKKSDGCYGETFYKIIFSKKIFITLQTLLMYGQEQEVVCIFHHFHLKYVAQLLKILTTKYKVCY